MSLRATDINGKSILFWVGCGTSLLSTTSQNVGMFLQKKSHLKQQMQENTRNPKYWRSISWWVATAVFVFGVVLDFVSLSLLPTTITLPLGSIGLIVSLLCAHFGLREHLSCFDIIGLILIFTGACITIVFSTKERDLLTIPFLRSMLRVHNIELWYFLSFFVLTPAIVVLSFLLPCALTYGLCPGINGVITMICGKIIGELTLQTLFYDQNQMKYIDYYAFVLCIVVSVLCQNHLLQRALAYYDNMIIVPVYYVCLTILNCLTGLLFFKDFTNVSLSSSLAFAAGIVIVCVGCILLSVKHIHTPNRLETFRTKVANTDAPVIHMQTLCMQSACPLDNLSEIVDTQGRAPRWRISRRKNRQKAHEKVDPQKVSSNPVCLSVAAYRCEGNEEEN